MADDPEKLARLADKVSSVGVLATESSAGSRQDYTRYEAFVIDAHGAEKSANHPTNRA